MVNIHGLEVCEAKVCRAKVLPLLFQMSKLITETQDLPQTLNVLLQIMERHMRVVRGMVTLHHRDSGRIFVHASLGLSPEEEARGVYRLGEGVTGRVVATGRAEVIPRISQEPGFLRRTGVRSLNEPEISFVCVPILRGPKVLGTISVERLFDTAGLLEQDVELLTIVAALLAQELELYLLEHVDKPALEDRAKRLQDQLVERYRPENMLGNSPAMLDVYRLIEKIAPTRTTVLILGESGVGKELVAAALHYASPVANGPFVRFNCAALPESLIESELFGHEKGSFTGASAQRKGRFEEADGGTIFLDEVGELTLGLQAKLLRVLQERSFERVGGNKPVKVDIRILAATNRDLAALSKEGRFREDLYYRLNVFPLPIPPLRDRGGDIITLADSFIRRANETTGRAVKRLSTPAIDLLMRYHWPGNVRELQNVIERAVILADDDVIHGYNLPPSLQTGESSDTEYLGTLEAKLEAVEYEMLIEALKATGGRVIEAGQRLGLNKRQMGLRLEKHRIDWRPFRRGLDTPGPD